MKKMLFIDTETTGVDRNKSGVWQIGGIIECGKREREFLFECDIFEQDEFDPKVTDLTGITIKELEEKEDPGVIYDQFISVLERHIDRFDKRDKFIVIGYGSDFDEDILRNWFEKNDDDYFFSWFWHPWLCMMNASAAYLQNERADVKNFKLETVADYLGIKIDHDQFHNALYDANIAREIFNKVCRK